MEYPNGAGKGDSYRPVDQEKYSKGWDRAFSEEFRSLRKHLDLLQYYKPQKYNLFKLKYESINTKEEATQLLEEVMEATITE